MRTNEEPLENLLRKIPRERLVEFIGMMSEGSPTENDPWIGEEPMTFTEYVSIVTRPRNSERGGITLYPRQIGFMERAGLSTAHELVAEERTARECIAIWGKGSGKDMLAALFISYFAYVCLNLRNGPQSHFGLAPNTHIEAINVATNENQARQVFFAYLKTYVKSPLFARWITKPQDQILADEIRFPQIDLTLLSLHSRAAGLDGYNPIAFVLDEADAFQDSARRNNAEEVYSTLRSSAITRLRNRYVGLTLSWMRREDGFLAKLKKAAEEDILIHGDQSEYVLDEGATWDINPRVSPDDRGIQTDYRNDPSLAAAMYECKPMSASDAFFEHPERIEMAVDAFRLPAVDWHIVNPLTRTTEDGATHEFVGVEIDNIRRRTGFSYFVGVDAGVKGDSYAVSVWSVDDNSSGCEWACPLCAMTHGDMFAAYIRMTPSDKITEHPVCGVCLDECPSFGGGPLNGWRRKPDANVRMININGYEIEVPVFREEAIIELRPEKALRRGAPKRPVDLVGTHEALRRILIELDVKSMRCDPWQSYAIIQRLRSDTAKDVGEIGFSNQEQYKRARLIKALLYQGCLSLLPNERRDIEWRRLNLNGYKIDHPSDQTGSKDIWDAESVAIFLCAQWKGLELRTADFEKEEAGF